MNFRNTILAASATFALGLSAASQAERYDETVVQAAPDSTRSLVVRYHPAELQSAEGKSRIEREIKLAAKEVCGPQSMRAAGSLSILRHNKACYDKAMASASAQMTESQVATR